ncbi:MAG: NAD(P)H-dependent oxidoreductase [Pseudomonadota bacterium]
MTETKTVLHLDASMRRAGSTTRALTAAVVAGQRAGEGAQRVIYRDLADGLPLIDEAWIGANFTAAEERTPEQDAALALSETLIAEIEAADTIVIGVPVYNFGVPAAFKAWIDLVARARRTFRYTENGPVGLLEGKNAIVVVASGGTEVDSAIDFATPWIRHVLGFIGIQDIEVVKADRQMSRGDAARREAEDAIAGLAA